MGHKPPPSRGAILPSKYLRSFQIITLPKTNSSQSPGSLPKRKESSSIFRCYVSFKEGYQIDVAKNQRTKN